jgi:hypothetical protein
MSDFIYKLNAMESAGLQTMPAAHGAWLTSKEGQNCAKGIPAGQYLLNRLELAFMAGWRASSGK